MEKKSQVRLLNYLMVGVILIIGFSLYLVGAEIPPSQLGDLNVVSQNKSWNVLKSTGEESGLIFWTANEKDKKTELGWIPIGGNCSGWVDKYLYDENNIKIKDNKNKDIKLKCESSKCDGQNCYYISLTTSQAINIDEYVKLGNNSIVVEYQDINLLEYQLYWANVSITLYKNISNTWNNTVNDIWVFTQGDSKKFGANDSMNEGLERYKYKVVSSNPIILNGNKPYIKNPEVKYKGGQWGYYYTENHVFDFSDICDRGFEPYNVSDEEGNYTLYNKTAECEFNYYNLENNSYLEVIFTSDKNIDPTITIDEADVVSNSLLTNVTAETGDANFTHLEISDNAPYDSLMGYYPFDGDNVNLLLNISYDWTKSGNDGVMAGGAVVNSSDCIDGYGNCLQLDGDGDHLDLGVDEFGMDDSNEFTISFWLYTKKAGGFSLPKVITRGQYGYPYAIDLYAYGQLRFMTRVDGDGTYEVSNGGVMKVGVWQHVAVTYKNGTNGRKIYVDNVLEGEGTHNGEVLTMFGKQSTWIGQVPNGANEFNGTIDEVMIFNRSLTVEEISNIYNNQSARFKPHGTQDFNDQTQLNLTGNRMNITTRFQNSSGSLINLSIDYYDGSWSSTTPQTIRNGTVEVFTTSDTTTNITLNYTFIAGNSTNPFYSPIIYGNIVVTNWTAGVADTCTYSGSGDWNIDCSDYCNITSNVIGDGSNFYASGNGWFKISANISGFTNYRFSNSCKATCYGGGCIRL